MKAVQFNASVSRYLTGKALGGFSKELHWRGPGCTKFVDVPRPQLPGPEWVLVATRFGGICGSDLGTIGLHTSPYFEPFSSSPFTFGHENMGRIAEVGAAGGDLRPGERVVVEPLLGCVTRGIDPVCPHCARGEINLCLNITEGCLESGQFTGYCASTGGSWSTHFLAHRSQVVRLPDEVSDLNGVLTDPLAVGLHAVLLDPPDDAETVLIQGAGTIGLTVLAALRGLDNSARTIVAARHPHQAEAARRLGADEVLLPRDGDLYERIADLTGGRIFKPMLGKRVVKGGANHTYECVGSDDAIDDALRLTAAGGTVIIAGVPGVASGIDWSSIFDDELTVRASSVYNHCEPHGGREWRAFDLALELFASGKVDLSWMVTHHFALKDWKRALHLHQDKGGQRLIKGVFEF
jgi:L-iditol 2-dehydrogenase